MRVINLKITSFVAVGIFLYTIITIGVSYEVVNILCRGLLKMPV